MTETPERTIGELARAAGIHVETVRYYERRGLIKQPKKTGGWRHYDDETLRKVRFVKRAQELGFSLDEIAELLALRASSSPRSVERVRTRARTKLEEIDQKLRDLEAIRRTLAELVHACPGGGPTVACPILGALDVADGPADPPLARGSQKG